MANTDVVKQDEVPTADKKVSDETKTDQVNNGDAKTTDDEKQVEKEPLTDELKAQIVRQLEYYFGDINLPRDKFLREQVELDDGWVPLTVLLTFNRLNKLCSDAEAIGQTIFDAKSELLEISEDQKKIRRNPGKPAPELNEERKQELQKRTAYAKGFPATAKLEEIIKFFEGYGENEAVHMRHYQDKATKKPVFKGSVFIIFKDVETCKKFLDLEEVKYGDNPLIRKWQTVYFEEKKLEREERNAKRGKNKKDEETDEVKKHTFPTGAILFMEGFTKEDTMREKIKAKIVEIHGSEPAYITFDKGAKDGYVRFSEENEAADFIKKVTDNKMEVEGDEITLRVLEGEEEETFLNNLAVTLQKIRHQHKNSKGRGRKRKGGSGDGPRSKQRK